MNVVPLPHRPHLRIVSQQPRPRRLEVRIAAADGHAPFCRGGPFRLAEDDLLKLVEIAMRLESRA